ncbi:MAG: SDR family oxidoreductase [Gammaproteobacteria bacterium]
MAKQFLIVGVNSAIGKEVFSLLTKEGHQVFTTSRSSFENPGRHFIMQNLDTFNKLDGLPNSLDGMLYCPGTINLKSIQRLEKDDVQNDLEINFFGAFNALKDLLPRLKNEDGSSVVFITTVAAKIGMPMHASIAAAKSALQGFAISMAAELAPRVAINCIAPSLTHTPLAEFLLSSESKLQSAEERHPLKKINKPQSVAKTIELLMFAKEYGITGQIFNIDGGLSALKA